MIIYAKHINEVTSDLPNLLGDMFHQLLDVDDFDVVFLAELDTVCLLYTSMLFYFLSSLILLVTLKILISITMLHYLNKASFDKGSAFNTWFLFLTFLSKAASALALAWSAAFCFNWALTKLGDTYSLFS